MNNKEIINQKLENAIEGLRAVFELCCPDECFGCPFAVRNNGENVCTIHHTMQELKNRKY